MAAEAGSGERRVGTDGHRASSRGERDVWCQDRRGQTLKQPTSKISQLYGSKVQTAGLVFSTQGLARVKVKVLSRWALIGRSWEESTSRLTQIVGRT